jgi:CDP-6-deoxy-D-xylo-4-hexulose-3-dehydrase
MQAAIGCAQLDKLPEFTAARRCNFARLHDGLSSVKQFLLPVALPQSQPSWFGFMITLRDGTGFSRNEIVEYLEEKKIQTRNLFAGNLTRHPCFDSLREGTDFRISGELKNTDKIMNDSFWIGVYPGMTTEKIDYMIDTIKEFINQQEN